MTELALGLFQMFTPAAAAPVVGGGVVQGVAQTAGGGFLKTLLQGGATALGAINAINAGNAQAEQLELAAQDAQREIPLETLQGITRRSSIKAQMMESVGQMDVANAASGVDLSFGTPGQARKDAFRQADLGLASDVGTEQTRVARLEERSADYRRRAKKARSSGLFDALSIGISGASSIAGRY